MKKIKRLLILIVILIVSGCKVEYNVNINSDLSVNEKVVATELTKRLESYTGLDEKQAVNSLYEVFDRGNIETRMSYKDLNGDTIATVTASHDSLRDYVENFYSDIADVYMKEEEDKVTLTYIQTQKITDEYSKSVAYDEVEFKINLPFNVIDHNADKVRNNDYTWVIKKDADVRKMVITFDKEDLKGTQKIKIGDKSFNVGYQFIAFAVIGLIIIIIVIVVYVKNKKNNRF